MTPRLLPFFRAFSRAARVSSALRAVVPFFVLIALGGIPGGASRRVVLDVTAPLLPDEVGERDASLLVTVRNRADRSPLAHARVRAFAMREDQAYLAGVVETDGTGRARITLLPRGELWILADARRYARGTSHVVLASGLRDLHIDLAEDHAFEVVVNDDQGVPVFDARIEACASDELLPVGARTDANGVARVTRLGAGPWSFAVRAPDYEEMSGRAAEQDGTVHVTLRKLATIAVRVMGPDDRAVVGARVLVAGATMWPARAAETSEGGELRIGGLTAGAYALRASHGDLVSPIELGVTVSRGEERSLVLRLVRGTSVGVRVMDGSTEDGPPVVGARVLLVEGGLSPFPLEAKTDTYGRARLGPVLPGAATLGVTADGFVPRGALPVAEPVPAETRVALVRSATLRGRVTDARGYPIPGATIEIVGNDPSGAPILDDPRRARFQAAHFDAVLGGPAPFAASGELGVVPGPVPPIPLAARLPAGGLAPARAFADKLPSPPTEPWVTRGDGTFRASPASPGRVRAIVRHPQYVEAQSQLVTLIPGGEAEVEIVLREGGSLEGRLVDDQDRPVRGARVFVAATRGSLERMTRTASDGTFAFAALPETMTLTVSGDEDEQPDIRLELAIPDGERKEVSLRLPTARSALAVAVVDGRDRAVVAVQLSASSLSADVPLRTTAFTDARGEAKLKRASGIPLRIQATAPGYAPSVVSTNGSEEVVRIALTPAESVAGEVAGTRSGEPIGKADVSLSTDGGVRRARTDARGRFAIGGLAPGPATLVVRAAAFAPATTQLSIPDSGGRRPFSLPRIELTSEGRVEGEVIDSRGDPVPGARVAKDHVPTWLLVGEGPREIAVADAKGRFALGELPEGTMGLEAYAPDVGHGRAEGVRVVSGRTTVGVRLVVGGAGNDVKPGEPAAVGSVAVTLGETSSPSQVVVVSVVDGSEAERAGLAAEDVLLAINDAPVQTIEEARAKLSGPTSDDVVLRVRRAERTLTMRVARERVRR